MSFMDYLASLPAIQLDRLYESHWTCQAVLRSLPPLAKQYVLRLVLVEAAVGAADMESWVKAGARSQHLAAIERMEQLRVLLKEKSASFRLNPELQRQLQRALIAGGGPPRERMPAAIAVRVPPLNELDHYAVRQWESVLLQLVTVGAAPARGAAGGGGAQNAVIMDTFRRAGLLATGEGEGSKLTEAGFQYLLTDTNEQLWQLMREYVAAAEERGSASGQLIAFLLELGFHVVGEAYSMADMSAKQRKVVEELAGLGLLLLQKGQKEQWFVPTRLAANLSASLLESASWQPTEGFIVVETNYRVYAYTSSRLQTEILKMFVREEYLLPNVVVCTITRESCNAAFNSGIGAEQIITFLRKHAHPTVAQRKPVVPETVSDQIRLWEHDRNRVRLSTAVLYEQFPSTEVYELVLQHALDIGALLWQDDSGGRLVVKGSVHEEMRTFIRRQRAA